MTTAHDQQHDEQRNSSGDREDATERLARNFGELLQERPAEQQERSLAECFARVNPIPCFAVLWTAASATKAMNPSAGDKSGAGISPGILT